MPQSPNQSLLLLLAPSAFDPTKILRHRFSFPRNPPGNILLVSFSSTTLLGVILWDSPFTVCSPLPFCLDWFANSKLEDEAEALMIPLSFPRVSSQSGYVCMVFYRRDNHVVEFQAGDAAPAAEEACGAFHFNPVAGHYTTLIGTF